MEHTPNIDTKNLFSFNRFDPSFTPDFSGLRFSEVLNNVLVPRFMAMHEIKSLAVNDTQLTFTFSDNTVRAVELLINGLPVKVVCTKNGEDELKDKFIIGTNLIKNVIEHKSFDTGEYGTFTFDGRGNFTYETASVLYSLNIAKFDKAIFNCEYNIIHKGHRLIISGLPETSQFTPKSITIKLPKISTGVIELINHMGDYFKYWSNYASLPGNFADSGYEYLHDIENNKEVIKFK